MDLVLRNKGWSHGIRLDATPPEGWGERFMLAGLFREPLLSTHEGTWQRWSGQAHAMFTQIDLAKQRATQAAETARKTAVGFFTVLFLSLLIGAFIASVSAALGGRLRDKY